MAAAPKVWVEQMIDHKAIPSDPPKYIYQVTKLVNRLEPSVGDYITAAAVKDLIDGGTNVEITKPK